MSTRLRCFPNLLAACIVASIPLMAAATEAADGPEDGNKAAQEAQTLTGVIVTGTRSVNRTEAESLSPIDVLTPADLASSGYMDIASALNSLVPALNFPRAAVQDGNDAARPVTLRGLSPDAVLVLVDGKRYHTGAYLNGNSYAGKGSAPVDLNSLPMSAIDRIEILRDGASAQYGSDAVAGVVNIVLKRGAREGNNEISVNGGRMSKGDGAQNGASASYGLAFGGTGDNGEAPGWVRVALNYQNSMTTNRAANTDIATAVPGALPAGRPGYQRVGDPKLHTYQGLVNFGYTFSPSMEAYGYYTASRRNVWANGYYRAWNASNNVPEMYPNGFLPTNAYHVNDMNGVLGLRGTTEGGWRWDASFDYGKNKFLIDAYQSANVNLFYSRGYSPKYFYVGAYAYEQNVVNLDLSKDFNLKFLPNPVTFAWGVQFRNEDYEIQSGEPESYYFNPATLIPGSVTPGNPYGSPYSGGAQGYAGIVPANAGSWDRGSQAAYVDLETDLSDRLSAGVAARYERFDSAGSVWAGKVSARYKFTDSFSLRGTVSNGFRAPTLPQSFFSTVTTGIYNGELRQSGVYRPTDPISVSLGARPLTPEKSVNIGLGASYTQGAFSSTLDLYQIRINDRIDLIDSIPVNFPEFDIRNAQYYANVADTRTRGADWINSYNLDLSRWGYLKLTASANWNSTKVLANRGPTYTNAAGQEIRTYNRASEGLLTHATPSSKYILSGDWNYGDFDLHANVTRYGKVSRIISEYELATPGNTDTNYPARWLLNLSAAYKWDTWNFTIGVDNVTNVYPSKILKTNPRELSRFGVQYSYLSPFGFNGRYLYGKIQYTF